MSAREEFIHYVNHGGDKPFVSMQIGAGAGFDTKLAGKRWNSETTLDDLIRAYELAGGYPLFNVGLPDAAGGNPALKRKTKTENRETERVVEQWLTTPYGELYWKGHEVPKQGFVPLKYPVSSADETRAFDIVRWYADQHAANLDYITDSLGADLAKLQPHGPVSVQWNMQPFELFGLPTVENLVMLAMLHHDEYRRCCDYLLDINMEICKAVFRADADFVFLGGPGSEMLSPGLYEDFLIPDSKVLTDFIRSLGKLAYTHICSPVQPFLDMGLYNRMGIDLFETLSPPPVGNVESLADARKILPSEMCTRGNIGLDILLNGTVDEVKEATLVVLEATKGRKHMVGASDYLFYDIPLENVRAVVETVESF
ncbi:methylcobalamin:coenzyme M methyltransferase [Limihaloglobus sulfuriphilus]|uniref:Methylcobalamin:coenzyme M methyltransferase n=1 Tax=Limihaloglobus sulfuriphilus TaxID=1851148 RepID=A0A1Q2MHH2_9BACT|nr:uroporphyrinogen decarboxylase family protein [Limihaloglobus sulfuriphilus]AQQ72099.1 methylcobalamin:coenzyme M methyltransferase [Limihaloglobus sulfuriphilus]